MRTFIKNEDHYAEWFKLVHHVYEKSPRASLGWGVYRNSGLENKYDKGVVIINTGSRQAVVTATLDELKGSEAYKLKIAKQRTASALNNLMFIKEPANDPRPPLSRDKLGRVGRTKAKPIKRNRQRALVPG